MLISTRDCAVETVENTCLFLVGTALFLLKSLVKTLSRHLIPRDRSDIQEHHSCDTTSQLVSWMMAPISPVSPGLTALLGAQLKKILQSLLNLEHLGHATKKDHSTMSLLLTSVSHIASWYGTIVLLVTYVAMPSKWVGGRFIFRL